MENLYNRYPKLELIKSDIESAVNVLTTCAKNGNKILVCGNGGSSADSAHIVGELLKGFISKRPLTDEQKEKYLAFGSKGENLASELQGGIPAIDLTAQSAILSAFSNDVCADTSYAQLVNAYAKEGDVLIGITTSGNAENVLRALITAKANKMTTILLTGGNGGKCKEFADVGIIAPENETYKVQEYHLPIYHCLCAMLEEEFF